MTAEAVREAFRRYVETEHDGKVGVIEANKAGQAASHHIPNGGDQPRCSTRGDEFITRPVACYPGEWLKPCERCVERGEFE